MLFIIDRNQYRYKKYCYSSNLPFLLFPVELRRRICNHPCLLVPSYDQILALDFGNKTSYSVISNLTKAAALDFHHNLGYIFWSDVTEHNIKRLHIQSNSIKTTISGIGVCDGLAVEWRSSKLYWSDTTYDRISISDLDGNNQRTIVSSELEEPRAIALDLDNR